MKKFQVLVISILLSFSNVNASFFTPPQPYSFGPEGRTMSDLRDFAKPVEVANILPNRPVASTDSSGARVYYSSTGRQLFSVSKDGQTSCTVGGVTKSRDKEGNIVSISERKRGTNIVEMKDSFGETVGFKTLTASGVTDKEYDRNLNLTKSYYYDSFGKTLAAVVNELTQEKTLYDSFGREKGTISMGFGGDGYVISTCQYDDVSYERSEDGKSIIEVVNTNNKADAKLLVTKKTYGIAINSMNSDGSVNVSSIYDTTYYDKEGLISKVVDSNGITIAEYSYKRDKYGNKVLTRVLNPKDKSVTYYENGRPVEERNSVGGLEKKYYYNGSRLLYTVTMTAKNNFGYVTYYDISGRALSTTNKFVQYDPSSNNRTDFVCGSEIVDKLSDDEIKAIEDGTSSLVEGKDYVIRCEINSKTNEQENVYYYVPNGVEGVNYIKKELKNDLTGEMETRFFKIIEKYKYDSKGNIKYVINLEDNTRTYYKNNKMYYVAANDDSTEGINIRENPNDPRILKLFAWDVGLDDETEDNQALTLRYVFDTRTQTTQWFNADSQFMYLTYNDRLISDNIYDNGKLVGTWNNQNKELTILRDEKQWITLKFDSEPGVDFIRKILSFAKGDVVDWASVNGYASYYDIRQSLLDSNVDLYKHIDTFEKYKQNYKMFKEQKKMDSSLTFMKYLETL